MVKIPQLVKPVNPSLPGTCTQVGPAHPVTTVRCTTLSPPADRKLLVSAEQVLLDTVQFPFPSNKRDSNSQVAASKFQLRSELHLSGKTVNDYLLTVHYHFQLAMFLILPHSLSRDALHRACSTWTVGPQTKTTLTPFERHLMAVR